MLVQEWEGKAEDCVEEGVINFKDVWKAIWKPTAL